MTFSTDSSMAVKMKYSEGEISAMHAESREARKHLRKLGRVMKTVAAHRLKELRHLQAVEKLATWRRTHGFDRLADGDNNWVHGPLPPTPEQMITASLWSDLNALKDAISMSGKDGSGRKVGNFSNEIEQDTVSFTDEQFTRIRRFVERRGHAAHVTVAPVDTAQYCSPRSLSPEISFGTCVSIEKNKEGRMDPEPNQLESPSASTGFEITRQQCHPTWETGRTTAAGCLTPGVGSNLGGDTSSPSERVIGKRVGSVATTPDSSKTASLQTRRKPKDKKTSSKKTSNWTPVGKEESHRLGKRVYR